MLCLDDASNMKSEVAMWHELSGTPDDVTSEDEVVTIRRELRWHAERALLRDQIEHLSGPASPIEVRGMARLAASYMLAGDAETARRYLLRATEALAAAPAK